jgi:integrase/recombinase XerD
MKLSKAVEGFLLDARAGRYSPAYVPTIEGTLKYITQYLGDPELSTIKLTDLQRYIAHLKTDYQPRRWNGDTSPLQPATVDNHWKLIKGFFNWTIETSLLSSRPDIGLRRDKFQSPQVVPFTPEEVKRMLDSSQFTQVVKQSGRTYRIKRQNCERDKAMLLILLDTGMRLGELTRLRVGDINLENGEVYIRPFRDGKKSRARTVYLGQRARQAVWRYVAKIQAEDDLTAPLIKLQATSIRHTIERIAKNARVPNAHPHKFRHTFAITYLRNHGDIFTLQRLLGHATLEMTRKYLDIAKTDIAEAHRLASPVDGWRL